MDIYEQKLSDCLDYVYEVFKNDSSTNISTIFISHKVPTWYAKKIKDDGHLFKMNGGTRGKAVYRWITPPPDNKLAKSLRKSYIVYNGRHTSQIIMDKKYSLKELHRKIDSILNFLSITE